MTGTPKNLKEWLDFEPVAGWSDAEKLAAIEAQQALSRLDAAKALFLLPLFAAQVEERKAAWERAHKPLHAPQSGPDLDAIAVRLLPFIKAAEREGTLNAEEDEFLHGLMGRCMFGGTITEEDLRLADLIMRRAGG